LQAIDRAGKDVSYYAVDLSLPELKRTFSEIPTGKFAAQQLAFYPCLLLQPGRVGSLIVHSEKYV
jgi:hypothetical protein